MAELFQPEIVPGLLKGDVFGEYAAPVFVEAILDNLHLEIERVFWNREQREWDRSEDPRIPDLEFRPYYLGEEPEEQAKPNLSVGPVELRWYKHYKRGLSVNVDWDANRWSEWHMQARRSLSAEDARVFKQRMGGRSG